MAGSVFYLSGTAVPSVIESPCRALGNSVMPCALVSLGIVISARLRNHGDNSVFHPGRQVVILIGKQIAQPVIAFIALTAFHTEPMWRSMGVLLAAMPVGTLAYAMSDSYKVASNDASAAVIMSTLVSLLLIPVLALIIK